MAKKVTVIKAAKEQKHTQEERRLKVCGYARVSTEIGRASCRERV